MIFLKRMPASNPLLPKQEKMRRAASYPSPNLFFVLIKLFDQLQNGRRVRRTVRPVQTVCQRPRMERNWRNEYIDRFGTFLYIQRVQGRPRDDVVMTSSMISGTLMTSLIDKLILVQLIQFNRIYKNRDERRKCTNFNLQSFKNQFKSFKCPK